MTPDLTLYFLAVLAVILLPGMDMAFVLANSLAGGRRGAISSVLGIAAGGLIHVIVGATGMAALMVLFPQLFHVLLLLGTCYLLWIGWSIFRSADSAAMSAASAAASSGAIFRRALTTCLLNPKAYAFMFAIFPAFVRSDTRSLLAQTIALCVITVATQLAVYGAVAALAVQSRRFMESRQKTIARTMGAMLMAAAVATATQAWSAPDEKSTTPINQPKATPMPSNCCPLLELRQYTLHPGKRDVLIELFEREFIESQEALGMRVVGQFRDAGNPDRFIWMRGFSDMPARGVALNAFYGGPVWQAHRDTANPTMIDASNVLLLRPISPGAGFVPVNNARAAIGTHALPASRVTATIYQLKAPVDANFIRLFQEQVRPLMTELGATPIAVFQTETAENNFPKLPIRTGEHVLVWFSVFANAEHLRAHDAKIANSAEWKMRVQPALQAFLNSAPERLILEPTARSWLK